MVKPPDSTERINAILVRSVTHVMVDHVPALRETQHYQFSDGRTSDDTLDVSASTLAPMRYFNTSRNASFDIHIDGTRISGWRTDSTGARVGVHAETTEPFFVSIMSEGFISALPLDSGATVSLPLANPPATSVHTVVLHATGVDTINTAHGPVRCIAVRGPGHTTSWIAQDDHRLVRMNWTLPNGTTVWKLPAGDVALHPQLPETQ